MSLQTTTPKLTLLAARLAFPAALVILSSLPFDILASAETAAEASLVDRLRGHVETLASDEFGGRGTGEPGIERAETYIASQFELAGLQPLPGRDSFRVPYTLYDRSGIDVSATWLSLEGPAGAKTAGAEAGFRVFPFSDTGVAEADVVFAGYGITSEDPPYDDYANIDVTGKIVLVLRHTPREDDADGPFESDEASTHALFRTKADNAFIHGAIGMILVTDPLNHPEADDLRMQRLALEAPEEAEAGESAPLSSAESADNESAGAEEADYFLAVHASRSLVEGWLEQTDLDLPSVQQQIDDALQPASQALPALRARIEIVPSESREKLVAYNVAGFLEGSDPAVKDEWIVVGAHHDHLGQFHGEGDTIFNGADDNASGVAGVLELARRFASAAPRPARSMVFLTFSAEERGLLGSRALVDQELIPVDRVRFMLNLDMIGRNPEKTLEIYGDGYARDLREIIETANASLPTPLEVEYGGLGYMGNSDHDAFQRRDVPFLFFFTGLHEHYHQLGDHSDLLDYDRMASIVELGGGVMERVADRLAPLSFIHWIPWLGASMAALQVAEGTGFEATVMQVDKGSRAEQSGLREGDIVRAFGEVALDAPNRLGLAIDAVAPGDSTTLQIARGSGALTVGVRRAHPGWMGIWHGAITEDTRKQLGLGEGEGVLVRQVVDGGPCDQAGLQAGDIVTRLGGYPVKATELRSRLAQFGAGETVDASVVREDDRLVIKITLGERPRRG